MSPRKYRPSNRVVSFEHPQFAYSASLRSSRDPAAVQRSLMPPPLHIGRFVSAAATTRQCRGVGGDFYDYLDTGCEFRVLLGDVCGKGTPAALQAALVQGILAAAIETDAAPADVLARLNRSLCPRMASDGFVTLFYGVMTCDHRFTYCNAGQCRPMLVNHRSVRRLSVGGVPPGIFGDTLYEEESLTIETGDTLVVFSDGSPKRRERTWSSETRGSSRPSRRTAMLAHRRSSISSSNRCATLPAAAGSGTTWPPSSSGVSLRPGLRGGRRRVTISTNGSDGHSEGCTADRTRSSA
jgi:Stage II sporulation protein E (SpoIIE)